MPSRKAHEAAARDNQRALAFLLTRSNEFPQWVTTVAFYTAVHAVEALFATEGIHSDDHTDRNRRLKRENSYQKIWKHFQPLWNDSLIARYLAKDGSDGGGSFTSYMSPDDVKRTHVDHNLRQIVNSVRGLLKDDTFLAESP